MNTVTQQGAVDPDRKLGEVEVKENPRQAAIDAMTERMEKAREDELAEAIASDPGLAMNTAALEKDMQDSNEEAIREGLLPPTQLDDGAASREPMHKEKPATPEKLPAGMENDPLAEFIVMDKGAPMFKTKVNGEEKLIPLEQARRQIQVGTAADIRMQHAAMLEQSATQRERAVAAREAALEQRTQQAQSGGPGKPAVPVQTDLSDEDLLDEAREIFNTAFSGTEEDAAKKLARTLSKLRAPATNAGPAIDENAIVSKAAKAAVMVLHGEDKKKDVQAGYSQFQKDYPDIMADPMLYKMADDMTDEIEREHPDWKISQVMDEAGKRTRSWVSRLKGVDPDENLDLPPGVSKTSEPTRHSTQTRQERKAELVAIPKAAGGAIHETPVEEPEHEQSPQEAFAALKQARGQPL